MVNSSPKPSALMQWKAFANTSWPAAQNTELGGWKIRDNHGLGGSRANSLEAMSGAKELLTGYHRYMIWEGDDVWDQQLDALGYTVDDAAIVMTRATDGLPLDEVEVQSLDNPLKPFWISQGLDQSRIDILARSEHKKYNLTIGRPIAAALHLTFDDKNRALVYALAVSNDKRRQGLGKKLMQGALGFAHFQGASELALMVRTDNLPAIALYEGLEFCIYSRYHFRIKT